MLKVKPVMERVRFEKKMKEEEEEEDRGDVLWGV